MNKIILVAVIFCSLGILVNLNSVSYAHELVDIVSGVSEKIETTFDTYRIISGSGEKDTHIVIKHFNNDNNLNKVSIKTIGLSGIFSEVLRLDIGSNRILFNVTYIDENEKFEYIINRKDNLILKKLLSTNLIIK